MVARAKFIPAAAVLVALLTACSDTTTGPTAATRPFGPLASNASGSTGSGGGGGGGGSTQTIPQVAGTWTGQEHYDPSLSVFFLPQFMNPPMSMTLVEDASGNITGVDNVMHVAMTGKASGNGSIVLQDGTYYGQKLTLSISGSVVCSNGSTGTALTGKFQRKEGFGTVAVDNCPII